MSETDALEREKQQILEYALSVVPASSRIRNLRWAESYPDGLVLMCELDRGTAVLVRLHRAAIRAYATDRYFQKVIQGDLREALGQLTPRPEAPSDADG